MSELPPGAWPLPVDVSGPRAEANDRDHRLFAQIADVVPQLICSFSASGEYLFINRAMREFTGLSLPLRHGQGLRELVHPEDLTRTAPQWSRAFSHNESFRVDVRLLDLHGRYRWFDLTSTPVREQGPDGEAVVWYTSATDVDDRRNLVDDVQLILDAFPGMIALWDRGLTNRYANAAHLEMLGVTAQQAHGRHMSQVIGPERYADSEPFFSAVLQGQPQHFDRPLQTPEGDTRQLRVALLPVVRDGELKGMLTVAQDVTDVHDARGRLFEAEGRFELAFEQAPLGCALLALDGRFTRVNPAMARMFGTVPADMVGQSLSDLLHPEELDDSQTARDRLLHGELAQSQTERRCRRRDGSVIAARLSKSLVRDRAGTPLHFFLQLEDVTERKRAEQALQLANAELRRSNEDLERFAYVASHDLQEPLRTVASYTRLLADRYRAALDERGHRYVDYAVDAAQRMQQLISGLLDISRLGKDAKPKSQVELPAVITAVRRLLAQPIAAASAQLEVGPLPVVPGHQEQLLRLFQNLIGNALKFGIQGQPPVIRIGAEPDRGGWLIWVADNGVGIAPAYHERVFGMFQRLHTREQVPGNGIGLAVVKRIVELHQGKVWIESEEGAGAKILLWLPGS